MYELEKPMGKIVVIGAGGHANSIANVAFSLGIEVAAFCDDNLVGSEISGINVINFDTLMKNITNFKVIVAIGDNFSREQFVKKLLKNNNVKYCHPLVHETASIGFDVKIGEGTVVMPQAVIGPSTNVGKHCIINNGAIIDHDCTLADYVSAAPGVIMGGNCTIGHSTAICIGASIRHKIDIGTNSVIGGGSFVAANVESNIQGYGIPFKVIRKRSSSESYL